MTLIPERAQARIPGGVNSPVRAFQAVGGTPVFFERASGPYLWDVDGKRYIDYVGSWGPMLAGHGHPAVVEAVQEAASRALSFGAPTEAEIELAALLCRELPSLEHVSKVVVDEAVINGTAEPYLIYRGTAQQPRAAADQ